MKWLDERTGRSMARYLVTLLTIISGMTGAISMADEPIDVYLTEEGNLKAAIVLKTGQEGFVGITGEIWRCNETGKWTVADYVNDKTSAPKRSGQLSKDKLRQLAAAMAAAEFAKLPGEFGRDLKVNRQLISIQFGTKTATCVLNPGETMKTVMPPKGDPKAATWVRFMRVEQSIRDQLKSDGKPELKSERDVPK